MKNPIIVVACPDQGEGTAASLHRQGPTFINAYFTNLVDRNRDWGDDLPRPRRSAVSLRALSSYSICLERVLSQYESSMV